MVDTHLARATLLDRDRERGELDQLITETRDGRSRVLVLRGEPGVGIGRGPQRRSPVER